MFTYKYYNNDGSFYTSENLNILTRMYEYDIFKYTM